MILIGLAGTNGAGKDTVGEMLSERHKFLFVIVSDLLREEAARRGQPVERGVLASISAEWRRNYGLGVLVDRAVERYQRFGDEYRGVVASSIRNSGEAQHLLDKGGILIWVDADPQVRYNRISSRQRTAEDNKTFEQFMAEEYAEMHPSDGSDDTTLDVAKVKQMATMFLENNGSDINAFKDEAEKILNDRT